VSGEERSAGLAAAARVRREALIALADELAGGELPIETIDPPAPGTVLVEVETRAGAFCFTEVVVTTATIALGESVGWGCVLGYDREGALAGALLDAARDGRVEALAREALGAERTARAAFERALAGTRV
jgi:alpha-D-ribose 1-methylphosphonate 5-triphosphate synthase subunit PhnG